MKKGIKEFSVIKEYAIDKYPNIWDGPSGYYVVPGNSLINMEGIPDEAKNNSRVYLLKGYTYNSDQGFCAIFHPMRQALYIGYQYGSSKSWQKITGTNI